MKLSRKIIIIMAAVLLLLIGGGVTIATNTPAARAQRQLNLGNKYLQEGKYQEAILAFQKVIQIEPKNIPARLGLGNAYIATTEYDKAETVLKEVLDIEPNNISAREELFKVYVKEGNPEAANGILKEIIALDHQKDMGQYRTDLDLAEAISTSRVSYELGIKQMDDKQYLEAIDSLQKVIKEDTERYDDAQAKISECKTAFIEETLQKAKDAAANEDYQTALDLLEQVLKIDPNNQEAKNLKDQCTQAIAKAKADAEVAQAKENAGKAITSNDQALQRLLNSNFFIKNYPGKFSFPTDKTVNRDYADRKVSDYFIVYSGGPLFFSSESKYLSMSYDHKGPLEAKINTGENIVIMNYYTFHCLDLFTRHGSIILDASNGKLYSGYSAVDTNFTLRLTFIE